MEIEERMKRMERQAKGVLRDHECECLDCEEGREFFIELELLLARVEAKLSAKAGGTA